MGALKNDWKKASTKERVVTIIGSFFAIGFVGLILYFILIAPMIMKAGEMSDSAEARKKLAVVREQVFDYTDLDHPYRYASGADSGYNAEGYSFLIIRESIDEDDWTLIYSEPSYKEEWTEEDIKGFDYVVVADAIVDEESYQRVLNGQRSKDTVRVRSESIELSYYDLREQKVISKQEIEGEPLPEELSSSTDLTIDDDKIIDTAKERLGNR